MLKVYGFGPTRWLRVQWILNELELPYEFVPVDLRAGEHFKPEFLRINPAHKLPVLEDGDRIITESAAIVLYLAEKHAEKGMWPADLAGRAEIYRWIFFVVTELEQPLWRITRNSFLYPEDKRLPADIRLAADDFRDMARVLEQHLADREFVVGDRFGAADCVTAYTLDWADASGLLEGFPKLRAYVERTYGRPRAPQRIKFSS